MKICRSFGVILFIVAGISHQVVAQADGLKNIVPPSPRTAEFNKFIDYKVSLENGLVENSINFHNITVDGVTIPIGISYHASGIKAGQTSGDVGLGWVLSPGYRISRTIYGQVDELSTMPDMNNVAGSGQNMQYYLTHGFSSPKNRDEYLSRFIKLSPGDDIPLVVANSANYLDGQFDIFTEGLPGSEGKFVITDKANKIVTRLNTTASKTSYIMDAGIITGFNVIDGNGVEYKLGNGVANTENLQVMVSGQLKKYNTAWLLSEVKTPLGKTIGFNYQPFQETSTSMASSSRTFVSGAWYGEMYIHYQTGSGLPVMCYATRNPGKQVSSPTSRLYNTSLLSSIVGMEETVTFNRNSNGTVSSILINRNSDLKQIKKITFFYSTSFGKSFLDSVLIAGSENNIQKYSFDYESKELNMTYYDCFGYYQDDNIAFSNGDFSPRIEFDFNEITHTSLQGVIDCGNFFNNHYAEGKDKSIYSTRSAYTLKKITYPSGGSTSYFYESNRYKDASSLEILGGGLRISKIISDDLISGVNGILERTYTYGEKNDGWGFATFNYTNPDYYVREKVELVPGMDYPNFHPRVMAQKKLIHSSSIQDELSDPYLQSKYGWYSKVRETYNKGYIDYAFYKDPSGSTSMVEKYGINQQYTVSGYNINFAYPSYYVPTYDFWDQIQLSSKTTYAESGPATYKPVQKEELEYYPITIQPSEELLGLKVIPVAVKSTIPDPLITGRFSWALDSPYIETGLNSLYEYATYRLTKGDVLLKKRTLTNYDMISGAAIKEETNYEYGVHNLLSKEEKRVNDGKMITSFYKYPASYTGITATDAISDGIKKMNTLNVVSAIVEKSTFRSNIDGTNNRLISSLFTSFRTDKPLADKISVIENSGPLTNFSSSIVQSGAVVKDPKYIERISFSLYDPNGNILQQQKINDVPQVYFWGYGKQYPVAKIVGADYTLAQQYINQAILDNLSTTDAQMRTELNKLRTNLPNAMVTTYTYAPLIGMTSETDPSGKTIFYEYDPFNRLKLVRDQDGKILKQFDYQYQSPITQ